MNNKKAKVILAVLMAIIIMFSSTAFAVSNQGVVYTALGDSIAYGTGATNSEGYTFLFNAHLTKVFGQGAYLNLSYDGATSGDLRDALHDPYDFFGVQAAVIASDVITISIGGNDLLGPFLEALGVVIFENYLNVDYTVDFESLLADLAEWEMDPTTQPHFSEMLLDLSVGLPYFVSGFISNWGFIIDQIRLLNPHADVYVNTLFNPLKFSPNLYQFADPAIQLMNIPIHSLAGFYNYKVVDVYSRFEEFGNPKRLAVGDLSTFASIVLPGYTGSVPLHPTDMGYKFIFNMHKDLME